MRNIFDAVAGIGVILKSISGFVVFVFLVWSMYFTGHYELGMFKGIVAFILLLFFSGFTSMFPFGTTFAPILFEWWWHDIAFWDFTTPAWIVTGISMMANLLLVAGIALSQNQTE